MAAVEPLVLRRSISPATRRLRRVFRWRLDLPESFVETGHADIADAGAEEEGAVPGRASGREEMHQPGVPGARRACLPLAGLFEELRKLLQIDAAHPDDVAERSSPARGPPSEGVPGRVWRTITRPGRIDTTLPKPLTWKDSCASTARTDRDRRDGVGSSLRSRPGCKPGVEGLFGRHGVGRVLRGDRVGGDDGADLFLEIILRWKNGGGKKESGGEAKHR